MNGRRQLDDADWRDGSRSLRVRACNDQDIRGDGQYVLYWMIAARRVSWNFALDRAAAWARSLRKPLIVFESLRCGYRWASDRLHRFVIEGMLDNEQALSTTGVGYYPYVELSAGADKGLLAAIAEKACLVVTDYFPGFFLPRMVASAADRLAVRLEAVDSNGIVPLAAVDRAYETAHAFRRCLHKTLRPHLRAMPVAKGAAAVDLAPAPRLPRTILRRWPPADLAGLLAGEVGLAAVEIDHRVGPAPFRGGSIAGGKRLKQFFRTRLERYGVDRNKPDEEGASGLSPYLHFGHVSPHEIFQRLAHREHWTSDKLAERATGSRAGWWNMSESAEAFVDQLITWRELSFNTAARLAEFDQYHSLPAWARTTLAKHASDRRPQAYSLEQLEAATTYDPLWNAAQRELAREGRMHNYLRMLWGKKILEWTTSPEEALAVMIELNNKYAVDGRDPNSYAGIFWVLGRYDRPWGPERPIFGKVRYMSSENTARKFRVADYVARYGR
jgi:deoxyribodipyrimidine photo-lyase